MIDTWNPAKLNEKISGSDSWNPAILNEVVTDRDSWNPAILNESAGETPVVFEATITASFPEGATCTATDGTTTLTADDNPMAFSIPNEGTWAVSCVANGVTFSEDVVITTNGQTETVDLNPDGSTITPTDSVGILIACAGIGDSEITTIAGALADVETLTAILESENAVDYLVRSTAFASDVTADSVAMTGIGAINYDADTLLADSTWRDFICNSIYFDKVLNYSSPNMTSATTPSGEVTASGNNGTNLPYYALDGNNSTFWYQYEGTTPTGWDYRGLQYDFGESKKIYLLDIIKMTGVGSSTADYSVLVASSSDGSSFNALTDIDTISMSGLVEVTRKYVFTANDRYYRLYADSSSVNASAELFNIKFYGRVDV